MKKFCFGRFAVNVSEESIYFIGLKYLIFGFNVEEFVEINKNFGYTMNE
jgi:hypothetical protein